MEQTIRQIFDVLDQSSRYVSHSQITGKSVQLNELMASLYSPGDSFQFVFNHSTRIFDYMSPSIEDFYGILLSDFNPELFGQRIHPDDVEHFLNAQTFAADFLFGHIEPKEMLHYKISYQYRIKKANGNYVLILHQAICISIDDEDKMHQVLTNLSEISHITKNNNYRFSVIGINGRPSYSNLIIKENFEAPKIDNQSFTKREIEILRLVAEGRSSKEIADHLKISYATVRTHRNNILNKSTYTTIPAVITACVRNGLL